MTGLHWVCIIFKRKRIISTYFLPRIRMPKWSVKSLKKLTLNPSHIFHFSQKRQMWRSLWGTSMFVFFHKHQNRVWGKENASGTIRCRNGLSRCLPQIGWLHVNPFWSLHASLGKNSTYSYFRTIRAMLTMRNAQCTDNALTAHVFLNQRRSLTVRFECFVSIFYLVLFPILTIRPMSSFECSVWIFYPVRFPILTICRMFSVEYSPFNVLCECFNDIRSDFPTWPMSSSCPSSCSALHEKLLGLLDSALFL